MFRVGIRVRFTVRFRGGLVLLGLELGSLGLGLVLGLGLF